MRYSKSVILHSLHNLSSSTRTSIYNVSFIVCVNEYLIRAVDGKCELRKKPKGYPHELFNLRIISQRISNRLTSTCESSVHSSRFFVQLKPSHDTQPYFHNILWLNINEDTKAYINNIYSCSFRTTRQICTVICTERMLCKRSISKESWL